MYWDNSRIDKINRILRNDPIFVSIFEETVGFLEYFYNGFKYSCGVLEKKTQFLTASQRTKEMYKLFASVATTMEKVLQQLS